MVETKAQQRLQKALDRLEAAADGLSERAAAREAIDGEADGEAVALRADRDRLSADLDKLRQDYAALERVAGTASTRLDDAIDRLKGAMEG